MAGRKSHRTPQPGITAEQGPDPNPSAGTNAEAEDSSKTSPGVWAAIGLAVAATLAIFTGLGIEEEFLRRMVRNAPTFTAWSIGLVIVGASLLAASSALLLLKGSTGLPAWVPKVTFGIALLSAVAVTTGMVLALVTGVSSLRSRDMPGLSLSAVKSSSGTVTISAEATAKSLRSSEKILLRFYGVEPDVPEDSDVNKLCLGGGWPDMKPGSSVMWWGESGPDQAGEAQVSESLVIAGDRFSLVCAYTAILNPQAGYSKPEGPGDAADDFFAWSLVDLRNLTYESSASPTPASSPPAAAQ